MPCTNCTGNSSTDSVLSTGSARSQPRLDHVQAMPLDRMILLVCAAECLTDLAYLTMLRPAGCTDMLILGSSNFRLLILHIVLLGMHVHSHLNMLKFMQQLLGGLPEK